MAQKEIIPNGDFAASTGWETEAPWTIAAGVASIDGSQVATKQVYTVAPELRGKLLVITFDVTRTGGGVTLYCGTNAGTKRVLTGTYTERLLMIGGDNIAFEADVDFNGNIDDVSGYIDTDATSPEISGGDTAAESSEGTTREYTLPTDIY